MLYSQAMNEVQLLHVGRRDGVGQIVARLAQLSGQRVLVVLPTDGRGLLGEAVDMARVKQAAIANGVTLGVVALDAGTRATARTMGIPAFVTATGGRFWLGVDRPWWLPRRARRVGAPTRLTDGDRAAMHRRLTPPPRWWYYLNRYAAIIVFGITLAILVTAGYYLLPSARITLRPQVQPIAIALTVVADPRFTEATASGATVPGRLLVAVEKWRATVATTGYSAQPIAPARGVATFVNRVPQTTTVPAGTRISTSTGERIIFQTLETVEVPPQIGGEIDVPIVALEPGTQGNLPAERINRIEGSLAPLLGVRNLFPTTGGAVEYVRAVTADDRDRLRAHVEETLFTLARATLGNQAAADELLVNDSIRLIAVYEQTFSHFVGEATDQLTLEMRAELHGTAISEQPALELVDQAFTQALPEGFALQPETVERGIGRLLGVDSEGRVSLEIVGRANAVARIRLAEPLRAITGQEILVAQAYLDQTLPLRAFPEVEVWPPGFARVPYVMARISTTIDVEPSDE